MNYSTKLWNAGLRTLLFLLMETCLWENFISLPSSSFWHFIVWVSLCFLPFLLQLKSFKWLLKSPNAFCIPEGFKYSILSFKKPLCLWEKYSMLEPFGSIKGTPFFLNFSVIINSSQMFSLLTECIKSFNIIASSAIFP